MTTTAIADATSPLAASTAALTEAHLFTATLALALLVESVAICLGIALLLHCRFTIAALAHRATHDHQTGLLTLDAAKRLLATQLAAGIPVSVALFDVDNFKAINDTYGHHAGDAALRHIARRLRCVEPAPSLIARRSGDEFLMIIEDGLHAARLIATAALESVHNAPYRLDRTDIALTLSVGVAVADDINSPDELTTRADFAMYHAKRNDGPHLAIWTPGMTMPERHDS